ncbi:hypothetical protein CVT25_011287 [Psilocybe cyanescens]|uniref:DUF6533 domain-containing protein n=1 Tax=Psilocybe cyanescens TaxID=93625 RepID=A0A409XC82_PSICY|nr:hypothetical protein CVT25_011287 [Psilocybe cyanescens]
MSTINHQKVPNVVDDISAMYVVTYMGFASFTMLIWDHIDTFEAEVEYIWKGKKGLRESSVNVSVTEQKMLEGVSAHINLTLWHYFRIDILLPLDSL